ncbi:MAG: hypothetical protein ACR2K6_09270 [Solirubrobacterales bacterium]
MRKVEIGFDGGQVLPIRLDDEALVGLRDSFGDGGWHRLTTDDATIDIALEKVVFIRTAGDAHKIGF